ncbi:hypothetical protein HIM_04188 [Hirsutella minnesotensis 3608]|uniref:Choline transport protein n=1 Tax=Hirsutella minnesotensis 3608 TaxID=1043627 RepID=A0A0F8A649_9HYPO|nr:hypothetical protein HIM_04188 [Hirsutella minnesotensis 3608]
MAFEAPPLKTAAAVELSNFGSAARRAGSVNDDAYLTRIGKKPVLKRHFGFLTILGFGCTVIITWEGSLILFLSGLQNGGPAALVYGFLIIFVGTVSVFATLSELVSMAPTSGGQYHWVSMLAPPAYRNACSYVLGWVELTGWQALVASGGYVTGTLIQGVILLCNPSYINRMANWHGTMLFWAIILFAYFVNTALGSLLAKFGGVLLIIHILGFFAVLLPLIILGEHTDSSAVFETWLNLGHWPTLGLSVCIGMQGHVFAFLGADAAIHMSEEIRNAAVVVPRSLMTGLCINGVLGWVMIITTLYCVGDIDAALAENPLYPFMAIFRKAVGSTAGAAAMASIVIIAATSATTGSLASASRVYFAFARDRGLPGWKLLRQVNQRTNIPSYAVLTTALIAILLSLVNFGGKAAFNGVISISIAGLFGSYLFAAVLLLYRRLRGDIYPADPSLDLTNTVGTRLTWGPWYLKGALGTANNIFSCIYLCFILFFSFWPGDSQVNLENMNWSILVTTLVVILSTLYYLGWARKTYTGPVIEINELRS